MVPLSKMAPLGLVLLLLFLVTSSSGKSIILFYQKSSCSFNTPSARDAFEEDDLASTACKCINPPANTVALKDKELDEGCSSKWAKSKNPKKTKHPLPS
jgi:hypothetical protein